MKSIIKSFIPPIFLNFIDKLRTREILWDGDYNSWEEVSNLCIGYDSDEILQKVKSATLKVKNGEAVYERDSVIFDEAEYSWPLLTALFLSAVKHNKINVLDFGGSLGSTYFQNLKFLKLVDNISWNVVEQKHFIDEGKNNFEGNGLNFYHDIDSCIKENNPNLLLLSSVLQYIEKPYELLDKFLSYSFEYIVIDRTAFNFDNYDRITLQKVPDNIYKASYPCWIFDKDKMIKTISANGYILVEEFNALDRTNDIAYFKGLIFKKK